MNNKLLNLFAPEDLQLGRPNRLLAAEAVAQRAKDEGVLISAHVQEFNEDDWGLRLSRTPEEPKIALVPMKHFEDGTPSMPLSEYENLQACMEKRRAKDAKETLVKRSGKTERIKKKVVVTATSEITSAAQAIGFAIMDAQPCTLDQLRCAYEAAIARNDSNKTEVSRLMRERFGERLQSEKFGQMRDWLDQLKVEAVAGFTLLEHE